MTTMIEARGLTKAFGPKQVVHGIDLSVERGEVLGFLGPNGAGKSTTMRMITGFLTPTSGSAAICGHDVQDAALRAKRHLGYLPEGAPLYPDMTAAAFLDFIAAARGFGGAEKRRRVEAAADATNIRPVLHQPIDTLSKGYKRRVGLAQALLHDPDVLVLDEPTDGLDPNQKDEVRRLIREISPTKAIIISTHILEEVDAVCTRALVIAGGRLVANDTPQALARRSPRFNAVTLRTSKANAEDVARVLSTIGSVSTVEVTAEGPDVVKLTAMSRDSTPIYGAVGQLVREKGLDVTDLRVEPGHLDDAFRILTTNAA